MDRGNRRPLHRACRRALRCRWEGGLRGGTPRRISAPGLPWARPPHSHRPAASRNLHGSSRQREAGPGLEAAPAPHRHVLPCRRPTSTLAPEPREGVPPSRTLPPLRHRPQVPAPAPTAAASICSTRASWQHVYRHPTSAIDRSLQICGACDHTSGTRSAHLTDQGCAALCTRTKSSLRRATLLVGTSEVCRSCCPKATACGDKPRPQNYSRNHLTNNITKMTL